MKSFLIKVSLLAFILLLSFKSPTQEFQGQAKYLSKSTMELGNWGARMSEAQKKQIQERLKNRLEKTFVLNFNKKESFFQEEEKLDAWAGATDTWGKNFARGDLYKNVTNKELVQSQEFYGKRFLVKDQPITFDWKMGSETKQIGQYTCFKATTSVPSTELAWYDFSWGDLQRPAAQENDSIKASDTEPEINMTEIEAWYTPQIAVAHGPAEYWGLPGLILEVSAGNTTMLCSEIVMNPKETITIAAPDKGKVINKEDYRSTIDGKMKEMRDNRGRRRDR